MFDYEKMADDVTPYAKYIYILAKNLANNFGVEVSDLDLILISIKATQSLASDNKLKQIEEKFSGLTAL